LRNSNSLAAQVQEEVKKVRRKAPLELVRLWEWNENQWQERQCTVAEIEDTERELKRDQKRICNLEPRLVKPNGAGDFIIIRECDINTDLQQIAMKLRMKLHKRKAKENNPPPIKRHKQ
jgi:hypothetical protein